MSTSLAPTQYLPENDPIYPLTASFNKFFQQETLKDCSTNNTFTMSWSRGGGSNPACNLDDSNSNLSMASDFTADDGTGGGAKGVMTPLPLDYVPGTYDVLCGRGKKNYNSTGKLSIVYPWYLCKLTCISSNSHILNHWIILYLC